MRERAKETHFPHRRKAMDKQWQKIVQRMVQEYLFICLGENRYMGGQNASSLNVDYAIPEATLMADGRVIVAKGKVVV
jgi:hypothetical protein